MVHLGAKLFRLAIDAAKTFNLDIAKIGQVSSGWTQAAGDCAPSKVGKNIVLA